MIKKLILITLVLSMVFLIGCKEIPLPNEVETFPNYYADWDIFYSEGNRCLLTLEQRVSCYKGCQFATQPVFNITPIEDDETINKLYDDCSAMCQEKYFLEFSEDGNIKRCEYREIE